jgi:YidC/Oxa1 family membrane protein insertase
MLRQQKTMELYSKAGASPFSGCLPMLFQMPILFAMFTFFPSCIELRGESFLWAHDLSAPDAIISWSGNIPLITEYFGNHISLFCLLMTATNIIYTYITMQSQGGAQMPGMKWMMYLMPVMFFFMFNDFSAGLNYYYFISLLASALTMWYLRKTTDDAKLLAKLEKNYEANKNNPNKKPSGLAARLEALQKQQEALMEEQKRRQQGK